MNRLFTTLLAFGLAASGRPAVAQAPPPASITLTEAERIFATTALEIRSARTALRSGLADARQLRAYANPTLSFTDEELGSYSERYFNLHQPLAPLWNGGTRGTRAEADVLTAQARFRADSARAVLDLRRAFLDAWYLDRVLSALRSADAVVADVVVDAAARVEEGDLPAYDLRRLGVTRAGLSRRVAEAEVALGGAERRLGGLLAGDGTVPRVRAEGSPPTTIAPGVADPVIRALTSRPEVAESEARAASLAAELGLAGRSWLDATVLTGGYKQQSDGLDGLFLGVQIPLPLFDRRSGLKDAARARAEGAQTLATQTRARVARDAALADARVRALSAQQTLLSDGSVDQADELLATARVAYAEGEIGVVELVDATEAFLDAHLLAEGIRRDLWLSRMELEYAVGGFPTRNETGAER